MPNKQDGNTLQSVLARAQMELKKAAKSADNPYFKSKYAGLDEVIEACRNVLNKHGIAVTQTVECVPEKTGRNEGGAALINTPQQTYLVTTLLYGDQSIRSVIPLDYKRGDMQSFGSALTYARRYGLAAICCLSTEDSLDDDGNKAVGEEKVAAKVNKRSNYRKPSSIADAATKVTTSDNFIK